MSQRLLSPSPSKSPYIQLEFAENEDQGTSKAKRQGLSLFFRRNLTVGLALILGLACVGLVILFTRWFSVQLPQCQTWSIDCNVSRRVELLYRNFGAVQGFATAVYSIGLAALAFSAHSFSESALWPLVHQQPFSIRQMDTFLEASRGSIPSTPQALLKARTLDSAFVLLLTAIITFTPLAAAPIVGKVYNRANMTVKYQGELQTGGGIGVYYVQSNPPGPVRERSSTLYTSWQGGLSIEPLPEYRNWFIDRNLMAKRGNFTVETVRIQQNIECRGWAAVPNDEWTTRGRDRFLTFNASMPIRKAATGGRVGKLWQHDKVVEVRDVRKLAVWVHNYTFENANTTRATLIFATLGGSKNVSGIACDISVEMMDDTLTVGDPPGPAISVNPMPNIFVIGQGRAPSANYRGKMNEVALWFAVAPVANGAFIYGTQPMYTYRPDWIPERHTSTDQGQNDGWTVDYIKNFIRVSTGASMLGEVDKWGIGKAQFPCYFPVVKMDPSNLVLLITLPLVILVCGLLLIVWNIKVHKAMAIPIMRKATLAEILKSSQTMDIMALKAVNQLDATKPSSLERLEVRFKEAEPDLWGLYNARR